MLHLFSNMCSRVRILLYSYIFPRKSMEISAPNQKYSDNSLYKPQVIVIAIEFLFYEWGSLVTL